jgi:hypothetical protein
MRNISSEFTDEDDVGRDLNKYATATPHPSDL